MNACARDTIENMFSVTKYSMICAVLLFAGFVSYLVLAIDGRSYRTDDADTKESRPLELAEGCDMLSNPDADAPLLEFQGYWPKQDIIYLRIAHDGQAEALISPDFPGYPDQDTTGPVNVTGHLSGIVPNLQIARIRKMINSNEFKETIASLKNEADELYRAWTGDDPPMPILVPKFHLRLVEGRREFCVTRMMRAAIGGDAAFADSMLGFPRYIESIVADLPKEPPSYGYLLYLNRARNNPDDNITVYGKTDTLPRAVNELASKAIQERSRPVPISRQQYEAFPENDMWVQLNDGVHKVVRIKSEN